MSKPWDNEPTPIIDDIEDHNELTGGNGFVLSDDARNLERRMRAAESLLQWLLHECELSTPAYLNNGVNAAKVHLEAAKKENEQ